MANTKQIQRKNDGIAILSGSYAEGHTLEWLDLLVHFTLNPEKHFIETITKRDEARIKDQLNEEVLKLRVSIQQQVFAVHKKNEAELLVRNYHATLTMMLEQTLDNQEKLPDKSEAAKEIIVLLISFFEELISLIEGRFAMYLSLDDYVPKKYFRLVQKELSLRLKKIKNKISINSPFKVPFEIIVNKLNRFLYTNEFELTTSYKNILYKKKLIAEIEKIDFTQQEFKGYTRLDEILIYLNFNSVEYINYLISFIINNVVELNTIEEKTEHLYFLYKTFNQLCKMPDTAYNQQFHSVEKILNNWFNQELAYLEKIGTMAVSTLSTGNKLSKTNHIKTPVQKILCALSTDQLGIILRAAHDREIIVARSLSSVFKSIVPHLSTTSQENLSYDSMRSKSYAAELRDRDVVIKTLQEMISSVKEF